MGFFVPWSWLVALSYLLGGEVWCDCPETNLQVDGGDYKMSKNLTVGSMLVYSCPEGFYPYPALIRICQPDGRWRPAPKRFSPQRCRVVECPDPNVLEYGDVFPPQETYFVNNETRYECYSGYTMRGSSRRVCLPNGKWSGSTPICSRDSGDNCADPGIPAGGSRRGNMFGIDDRVTYSCNGNLLLIGSRERVCQENGQWTGEEPACYYKHTYDTPLDVAQAFGREIKDNLIDLTPNDSYEGRGIRILNKPKLNIYVAMDISDSTEKTHLSDAKQAVIKLIEKISTFSVTTNYEILFFSNDVFEVVNITDLWDGKRSLSTIIRDVENFSVGDRKSSGKDLNLVFKTFLERMASMKLRVGEEAFKIMRHIIIVFTDGAYNMGGSPAGTVAKIKNMIYMSNSKGDTHPREEHLDIYVIGIGHEIFDDDLQPLTEGTGGRHYFRMKEIKNLNEAFDKIIDENDIMGICGLHKVYETADRDSRRKMYPWLTVIHIQNEGRERKCLGSLVSPQFVLTAADCFTFGDLPEHVTVEIDYGQGTVKRFRSWRLHMSYNVTTKVKEVAVIYLDTHLKLSSAVRPICIPCTQDVQKLLGISTCKGQEQYLSKNPLERLTLLNKTDTAYKIHGRDAGIKIGDTTDSCISHAPEAPGTTTDNPKDATTDNLLSTGGAVFKNYAHQSVQVAVASWGTNNLCKSGSVVESDDTSRDSHINLFRVVPFLKSVLGNLTQEDYEPLHFLES